MGPHSFTRFLGTVSVSLAMLLTAHPASAVTPSHTAASASVSTATSTTKWTKVGGWKAARVLVGRGEDPRAALRRVRVRGPVGRVVKVQKRVDGRWRVVVRKRTDAVRRVDVSRVAFRKGTYRVRVRAWQGWAGRTTASLRISGSLARAVRAEASGSKVAGGSVAASPESGSSSGSSSGLVSWSGSVGAVLPVTYSVGSLSGLVLFVAVGGSDSASGSVSAPLASVSAAVSRVPRGGSATVVVRGGTYRQGNVSIPSGRRVRIVAYPGEVPVFSGARVLSDWVVEGSLAWHRYTPQPVTDGSGISFSTGQNLTGDGVGKYPDQAWVGGTQLRQVSSRSAVSAGRFWVDQSNKRIYLAASDVARGGVEASDRDMFASISGAGSSLEGLRITRYSPSADDYGAVRVNSTAHGTLMRHVEISDTAFQAVQYAGRPLKGATMENVTITRSNWMGVGSSIVDDLVLRRVKITDLNQFGEFTTSPQSGALKTSRNRRVSVIGSLITGNNSHGLWFDQSNVDVDVIGNTITGNNGSAVFFEISDDLLMINNYVRSAGRDRAVKLAGSSGIKLLNNTIVGGADPIGVYVDSRSKPGCADPAKPLCPGSYSVDRDTVRPIPDTLDWMPRIDLMLNNIIAHPTATGYCGTTTALCITASNGTARAALETVIHKADPTRGIPQTRIDGNVYTNATSTIAATAQGRYTNHSTFSTALAAKPVAIPGNETHAKTGTTWTNPDGTPTSQLTSRNNEAAPTPTNPDINQHIPAGTRHYGPTTSTAS